MLIKFAIKDFIDDRTFKNVSVHTLVGYEKIIKEFHAYCVENELVNVEDVTPSVIRVC